MRPRRTPAELRIVDRDRADSRVRDNVGLIHSTLRRVFPWTCYATEELYERLVAVAMWSLAKADRDYDASRGEFSTIATKYITNDVLKHEKRRLRSEGKTNLLDENTPDESLNPAATVERADQLREAERRMKLRRGQEELDFWRFQRIARIRRLRALRIREKQVSIVDVA